jgi:hypothetical protein
MRCLCLQKLFILSLSEYSGAFVSVQKCLNFLGVIFEEWECNHTAFTDVNRHARFFWMAVVYVHVKIDFKVVICAQKVSAFFIECFAIHSVDIKQ